MSTEQEKMKRMQEHLLFHPADYQTRISLLKNQSKEIQAQEEKKKRDWINQVRKVRKNHAK
ncbi:hypothetical protein FACS189418_6990 [Clostridia bacterium]|nr:hypothetical protein FACS189418_6990 [Clostridia bacterium]